MKKTVFVMAMIAFVGFVYAADETKSEVGLTPIGVGHQSSQPVQPDGVDGTEWITYDDGTAESFYVGTGAAGNVFVETDTSWASFYCDGISAYMTYIGSVWMSGHLGFNTAGTGLTGYEDDLMSNTGTGTGWLGWGATTTGGFFNNPTFTWQDTAYIAAYYSDGMGQDTNGAGSHGFSLTSYTGTGFVDEAYNAMLRARFNGPGVPVELMGFTVE
jgi:hypothetical protein